MRRPRLVVGGLLAILTVLPHVRESSARDDAQIPPSDRRELEQQVERRIRICREISELETKLAEMRTKYTDEHPRIQLTRNRLDGLRLQVPDCSV